MRSVSNHWLALLSGLIISSTLLLTSCTDKTSSTPSTDTNSTKPTPPVKDVSSNPPPPSSVDAVCSTLDQSKTPNCSLQEDKSTSTTTLTYQLTTGLKAITIPVESGQQPNLTVQDALVYNGSLAPERLVVRPGDTLNIHFTNAFPANPCTTDITNNCIPQRFASFGQDKGMTPVTTNLHTHGLVTAWDFKNANGVRGDNVLTTYFNPTPAKPSATNASVKDMCTTAGNEGSYRYPILADHTIGLNWYHPHPHGVTGFQVEAGMSGLLMIADAEAEKYLNPTFLQLKDMQVSRPKNAAATTYQFEKFVPEVATACFNQGQEAEWVFDNNTPGRCNYHQVDANGKTLGEYAWLFLVNGQLFPQINVADSAYLRLANSSANATYRLMLEPETTATQTEASKVYYTPAFQVIEKDGMTTLDPNAKAKEQLCTLTMTTATRVGLGIQFSDLAQQETLCKLTVNIEQTNKKITHYQIEPVSTTSLSPAEKNQLTGIKSTLPYHLIQEGINTGEDDWPPVKLAKLVPNEKLADSNILTYQQTVAKNQAAFKTKTLAASTTILKSTDPCEAKIPPTDADGINRHFALYYGQDKTGQEHFGLVASGELNQMSATATKPVDMALINQWRTEYQNQFKGIAQANTFVEYDKPNLETTPLAGLVLHKFGFDAKGNIITNVCTKLSPKPEHWRIHNLSAQIHNFHLHQSKFKVLGVRGATCMPKNPFTDKTYQAFTKVDSNTGYLPVNITTADLQGALDEQCVKTYAEVFHDVPATFQLVESTPPPAATTRSITPTTRMVAPAIDYGTHDTFPVPPMGYIDIEVSFNRPEQVGEYVFHCHILEHEDAGMMGKIVGKST